MILSEPARWQPESESLAELEERLQDLYAEAMRLAAKIEGARNVLRELRDRERAHARVGA